MQKLRVGVVAYWKGYDRKIYLKAAQLADELGYESFWVPEAWGYNCFPLLTEMALKTKRIKLATGIVNIYSRSPALLAMSAATMHEISDGRFMLGIGSSAERVIEGFHGRKFEKPLTLTRDILKVVRGLLRGESLDQVGAELTRTIACRCTWPRSSKKPSRAWASWPTAGCPRSGRTATWAGGSSGCTRVRDAWGATQRRSRWRCSRPPSRSGRSAPWAWPRTSCLSTSAAWATFIASC
jgi:alkanesulfonate monooxygenase SsuD/methylene tetrahydromethanopterin reductase-like flavin-dependent oxidoreductase (luciferase family)